MNATSALLRQRLSRDAVQLPLWIGGIGLLALASIAGVAQSYGSTDEQSALITTVLANPVIMLFRGLPSGTAPGAFLSFLILPFLGMMAGFMNVFLAVRHTRGEEEEGRAELVGATRAGRRRPLVATLLHGTCAAVLAGALTTILLLASGLPGRGSVVSGLATAGIGLSFLGVAALAAQLMPTSRAANSVAVWILLLSYLAAGIGNAAGNADLPGLRVDSSWLTWLSPFGWAENSRPFDSDALSPLLPCLVLWATTALAAVAIQANRDIGASVLRQRRARASASRALSGPIALVARQMRWPLLGWAIGGMLTGLLSTSLASAMRDTAQQNPAVAQVLLRLSDQADLATGTVVVFFTMLGILAAALAVQTIAAARHDEAIGTAEALLSAGVGRIRWLGSSLLVAAAGIVLVVVAAVAGAAVGLIGRPEADPALMRDAALAGAGQALAATTFLAAAALLFVVLPRWTALGGWLLVFAGLVLGLFGPLFGAPDWLVNASPIAAAPTVADGGLVVRGGVWLLLASTALLIAAVAGVRRRELVPAG